MRERLSQVSAEKTDLASQLERTVRERDEVVRAVSVRRRRNRWTHC